MTKIGEGGTAKEPSVEAYRAEADKNTIKFRNALLCYDNAQGEQKAHFKAVMDTSLELIKSSVSEIKKSGIQKQEEKLEKGYENFLKDGTVQNKAALEQDLNTLRAYINRS